MHAEMSRYFCHSLFSVFQYGSLREKSDISTCKSQPYRRPSSSPLMHSFNGVSCKKVLAKCVLVPCFWENCKLPLFHLFMEICESDICLLYFSYCLSSCNYRLKPATKKVAPKAIPATPTIKTVTAKPPGTQNVVVKRPPGTIVNVTPKSNVVPKPVLKFTSGSKVRLFHLL